MAGVGTAGELSSPVHPTWEAWVFEETTPPHATVRRKGVKYVELG
jgi:hypothetical protein